jgi:glycosyltransferase involved in cell wall biosynthesis
MQAPRSVSREKRVAVLIPTHWEAVMGGAQYQAKLMMDELIARGGFELTYLARRIDPQFQPEGYGIRRIGTSTGNRFVLDTRTLLGVLEELKPDTIYHQVGCAYTGVAAWYARNRPCRFVWHIASDMDLFPWDRGWLRRLSMPYVDKLLVEYGLRHADAIVAQTRFQADLLERNYGRKVDGIVSNFHPAREEPLAKGEQARVLWIANLKAIKQPRVFLQLAEAFAAAHPELDARFVVMGAIQYDEAGADNLRSAMAAVDNLDYLGELSQDEVNAELARAHLLVNTSVLEGFSNTFIQAWMRQVPVLSLNVNPDGLLDDDLLGGCANGDFNALLALVARYVRDVALRERIGAHAEQYALEHHSYKNIDALAALF